MKNQPGRSTFTSAAPIGYGCHLSNDDFPPDDDAMQASARHVVNAVRAVTGGFHPVTPSGVFSL